MCSWSWPVGRLGGRRPRRRLPELLSRTAVRSLVLHQGDPNAAADEADDGRRVSGIVGRFTAWLAEHDVPYTTGSYDESAG